MDPQNGMFPQEEKKPSQVAFWSALILVVVIISGVIWYFWPKANEAPVAEVAPSTTTQDVVKTAPATITTALSDLDAALLSIDSALASTNDTAPTL
jgi:hypothetical protein